MPTSRRSTRRDRSVVGQVDAFWYAYPNDQGGIWQDFERLGTSSGYERVSHLIVTGILSFDLYLKPGARLPEMQAVPVASPGAAPWQLPTGARLDGAGDATTLVLTGTAPATLAMPYTPDSLYLLEVESDGADSGNAALALQCLDGANAPLLKPGGPPASHGAAGWETARAATFCPAGTATLRVSLANRGAGTVSYKNVRLWRVPQVTVTGNR